MSQAKPPRRDSQSLEQSKTSQEPKSKVTLGTSSIPGQGDGFGGIVAMIGMFVAIFIGVVAIKLVLKVGNFAASLFGAPNGPPGRGGGGDDPAMEQLATNGYFWIFCLYCIVFCLAIWLLIRLIAALPYKPDWYSHYEFKKRFIHAPFVILGVLYASNIVPTLLIKQVYTPRMFAGYIAAILGFTYTTIYGLAIPKPLLRPLDESYYRGELDEEATELLNANPNWRYLLSLIALLSVSITAILILTLIPNSFARAPTNWADVFWPPANK